MVQSFKVYISPNVDTLGIMEAISLIPKESFYNLI